MNAAPGIVTSGTGPPNAVVQVQPGMQVQPVVLVDANGNYVTTSGSTATAGYLADLTGSVNVSAATAPTAGQVLTATSGSAATWQTNPAGFANPMTTLGDLIYENATPAAARLAGGTVAVRQFLNQTGNGTISAAPAWGTIAAGDLPFALPLPVIDGGTGGTTATLAFGNLSPMTTLGDMLFQNSTPVAARLAGNTSATKMFLTQTGNGTVSANPAWGTIASTDLPPTVIPAVTAPGTTATLANTAAAAFASTSGGVAYTITLGSAPTCGAGVAQTVVLATGGTTLSVAAPGSQQIGGGTVPYKLYTQGDRLVVMSDGSNWQVTDYAVADLTFTSTQTFTVPGGWTLIDASVIGGGAGGGGGGSPSSNIAQVGGAGGNAAIETRYLFSVTAGLVMTCTVGGAGQGGGGGAAGGNAGTAGGSGTASTISATGIPTVTSAGGHPGAAAPASSTSQVPAAPWGNTNTIGASGGIGANYYGASGGAAGAGAYPGGLPIGLASGAGGGGGAAGTATSLGGSAGSPGSPSGGGGGGAAGAAGAANGGTATSAASTSYGAGGGGGGGGATNTGVGGPGGNGGPGVIILRRRG